MTTNMQLNHIGLGCDSSIRAHCSERTPLLNKELLFQAFMIALKRHVNAVLMRDSESSARARWWEGPQESNAFIDFADGGAVVDLGPKGLRKLTTNLARSSLKAIELFQVLGSHSSILGPLLPTGGDINTTLLPHILSDRDDEENQQGSSPQHRSGIGVNSDVPLEEQRREEQMSEQVQQANTQVSDSKGVRPGLSMEDSSFPWRGEAGKDKQRRLNQATVEIPRCGSVASQCSGKSSREEFQEEFDQENAKEDVELLRGDANHERETNMPDQEDPSIRAVAKQQLQKQKNAKIAQTMLAKRKPDLTEAEIRKMDMARNRKTAERQRKKAGLGHLAKK